MSAVDGLTPDSAPAVWVGEGWRCWRVVERDGVVRLQNPWQNSGYEWLWEPGGVEVAECFWAKRPGGLTCQGLVSPVCSCGVRSMDSLANLAWFLEAPARRDPAKASVIGRIELGGRMQTQIPGRNLGAGYQRALYARIAGPLYVSPLAAGFADALRDAYAPLQVHAPDGWTDPAPTAGYMAWRQERSARQGAWLQDLGSGRDPARGADGLDGRHAHAVTLYSVDLNVVIEVTSELEVREAAFRLAKNQADDVNNLDQLAEPFGDDFKQALQYLLTWQVLKGRGLGEVAGLQVLQTSIPHPPAKVVAMPTDPHV